MRHRIVTFLLFVLMLGVSTESHAFLEWLHKLSGPGPFIGLKVGCRFTCEGGPGCRVLECGVGPGFVAARPTWTGNIGCSGSRSYQNDLDYAAGVDAPNVWIWSLEPSIERWLGPNRAVFLGVGYAFTEFQGTGFEDFRRDAWTLRVGRRIDRAGRRIHGIDLGVKYMIFEDEFRPEEFGALPGPAESRGVAGLFATFHFLK